MNVLKTKYTIRASVTPQDTELALGVFSLSQICVVVRAPPADRWFVGIIKSVP